MDTSTALLIATINTSTLSISSDISLLVMLVIVLVILSVLDFTRRFFMFGSR